MTIDELQQCAAPEGLGLRAEAQPRYVVLRNGIRWNCEWSRLSGFSSVLGATTLTEEKVLADAEGGGRMFTLYPRLQSAVAALRNERGAASSEYGFLLFFIALLIIAGATALGVSIRDFFNLLAGSF
jgi:Flp pilus assembly pilin Flp